MEVGQSFESYTFTLNQTKAQLVFKPKSHRPLCAAGYDTKGKVLSDSHEFRRVHVFTGCVNTAPERLSYKRKVGVIISSVIFNLAVGK